MSKDLFDPDAIGRKQLALLKLWDTLGIFLLGLVVAFLLVVLYDSITNHKSMLGITNYEECIRTYDPETYCKSIFHPYPYVDYMQQIWKTPTP